MSVTTMQASGSKPVFTCSECSATYSRMEYLRRHERKHTETRPFQCEECMKSFARSDVLLRHRRRCHPEAEAIREANALLDSQAEGGQISTSPVTSGRAKLKAAGLTRRSQGRPRQPNEASSNPSEAVLSPEISSLDGSNRLVHGPSPPNAILSADMPALSGFDQFFLLPGTSTDTSSLTRTTSDSQPLSLLDRSSPATSFAAGNSGLLSTVLPPLSLFNPTAIIPKSGAEVSQFGSWYVFPQRHSPTGSGARGSDGQLIDLSDNKDSNDNQLDTLQQSYLLGDGLTADQLDMDLLSPERSVYNTECRIIYGKRGEPLHPSEKFYIPPGLFAGCYTIPHWLLPPLTRLSKFAARTLTDHLVRFPIVHQATFKLSEASHWLAFAMCTVGGLNPTETKMKDGMGGEYSFKDPGAPWDGVQSIVRTEKVDMLVKTFVRHSAKLALCDQVSIVQSLLLYNTPAFLSDDPSERIIGHLFLGTVVRIIRKSGMFHPSADFASRLTVPADATLDVKWHKWVWHETCRRSAWFVYVLDTIACLEAGIPSLVSPRDPSHLALPACESMWSARSEIEWATFAEGGGYQTEGITLDIAMRSVFGYDNAAEEGRPDAIIDLKLGPFARTIIVMTLLRGLIEFGQGKPKGGVVTQTWITEGLLALKGVTVNQNWITATYMRALARWREGWDFDPLCTLLTAPQTTSPSLSSPGSSASHSANSPGNESQGSPSDKSSNSGPAFFASTVDTIASLKEPVFVNDALPYYWLALVLVDMLKPGVSAEVAQGQTEATAFNQEMNMGSASLGQDTIPPINSVNGTGLTGIPNYNYGPSMGTARIADLDDQNDKFAGVDFREMLVIAKDFARGDTGTMRAPSLAPFN